MCPLKGGLKGGNSNSNYISNGCGVLVAYSGGFREADFPRQNFVEFDVLGNDWQLLLLLTVETGKFTVLTGQVNETDVLLAPVPPIHPAKYVIASGVGTYLSGTARAVPLLKVHIALMIDV